MTLFGRRKTSGDKDYYKVEGDAQELNRLSNRVREPVKPTDGRNLPHVDVPARKIGWVRNVRIDD